MNERPNWISLATEIRRLFDRGKASTMDLARAVASARQSLDRGQWSQLWRAGNILFSKRKGDMLVRIGYRLGRVDAQTFAQLPAGWSVLYCLAHLERGVLGQLVAQGQIHPHLTLRQA